VRRVCIGTTHAGESLASLLIGHDEEDVGRPFRSFFRLRPFATEDHGGEGGPGRLNKVRGCIVLPGSTLNPITLALRLANSSCRPATLPSSVVQTGVKSLGWEKRTAQPSPIHS
jgi:hypothetical protein